MENLRKQLNAMAIGEVIELNGVILTKVSKYKFASEEFDYSTMEVVENFSN